MIRKSLYRYRVRLLVVAVGAVCFLSTIFVDISEEKLNINQFQLVKTRFEIVEGSLCIDKGHDGTLTWQNCNPRINQNFDLTRDGQLVFSRTGQCVAAEGIPQLAGTTLKLEECASAHTLQFQLGSFNNMTIIEERGFGLCIAAKSGLAWVARDQPTALVADKWRSRDEVA